MINSILLLLLAYFLGSLPFGFLITRLSTGKNILKIGWRKTSGSNVFKNIGLWQGALTGILDLGKGFLAVRLAQNFNVPVQLVALCGVAAVIGHNWSFFLKFAGGRGIGTFGGALLAFSPKILELSLIPFILLGIIWNLAIGTIVFLATAIMLSVYFNQLETTGLFSILSLFPIFLKRLSPIEEIKPFQEKKTIMKNRLLFDDDAPPPEWRITKIVKTLTKR